MGEIFDFKIITVVMLFVILVSIQLTLNKILFELRAIRKEKPLRRNSEDVYK